MATRVVVADVVATLAVAGAVHPPKAVVREAAITAVAHAPPTQVSQGKTQATVAAMVLGMALHHVVIAVHKAHVRRVTTSHAYRVMKCNARTRVAHVWTWVSSATTSTNASPAAMCQQAFRHLACLRVAAVAVAGVATVVAEAVVVVIAAVAVETGAVVVHAQVAAVAVAIQAADFNADRLRSIKPLKKQLQAAFLLFCFFYL